MNKKILHCSDFDGTLTTVDTLLSFIRFARGTAMFVWGFVLHLPLLVLMKLKLYSNDKMKERIFGFFFQGMPLQSFEHLCQEYARRHRHILRKQGEEMINCAIARGEEVMIVSASIDRWIAPFFQHHSGVQVVSTTIEVKEGKVTGKFLSPNCYGAEKVERIQALIKERNNYYIIAYGDSRGDQEMLDYADEKYYQPFRS